ncbi:MAG: hypothetical protein IRZ03_14510 [Acidobacterium ailaaui]|nr:hypothetical protein [Pseudacidobacterium ailaaui]
MRDVAVELGVSQHILETEYYMVDLPAIVDRHRQLRAIQRLEFVGDLIASNNRSLDDSEYKRLMKSLQTEAGFDQRSSNDRFDREAFEQLRFLTAQGANRVR